MRCSPQQPRPGLCWYKEGAFCSRRHWPGFQPDGFLWFLWGEKSRRIWVCTTATRRGFLSVQLSFPHIWRVTQPACPGPVGEWAAALFGPAPGPLADQREGPV